jgi:subtilisin-like proprotein convertase family protein
MLEVLLVTGRSNYTFLRPTYKEGGLANMRQILLLLATMALALLLASGVALAVTTVVTETFSNTSPIDIVDGTASNEISPANPYPSEITVSGLHQGSIRDVNLKLRGFTHHFPDDVGVLLVGPDGQRALVMSDVGGTPDVSATTLTLDDEAANSLPDNTQITKGTFKPTQGTPGETNPVPEAFPSPAPAGPYGTDLSVFDGTNPNGTWELYVLDDSNGDKGNIRGGWSLRIRARVTV